MAKELYYCPGKLISQKRTFPFLFTLKKMVETHIFLKKNPKKPQVSYMDGCWRTMHIILVYFIYDLYAESAFWQLVGGAVYFEKI